MPPAPTIGTRPSRSGSSSTANTGPSRVEAEQQRLGAVELGQRDELEPPAGDPQPAVAGDDGARAGMRELLGEPLGVAAPRVARAVERGSRERVLHPLDVRRTGGEARIGRAGARQRVLDPLHGVPGRPMIVRCSETSGRGTCPGAGRWSRRRGTPSVYGVTTSSYAGLDRRCSRRRRGVSSPCVERGQELRARGLLAGTRRRSRVAPPAAEHVGAVVGRARARSGRRPSPRRRGSLRSNAASSPPCEWPTMSTCRRAASRASTPSDEVRAAACADAADVAGRRGCRSRSRTCGSRCGLELRLDVAPVRAVAERAVDEHHGLASASSGRWGGRTGGDDDDGGGELHARLRTTAAASVLAPSARPLEPHVT